MVQLTRFTHTEKGIHWTDQSYLGNLDFTDNSALHEEDELKFQRATSVLDEEANKSWSQDKC